MLLGFHFRNREIVDDSFSIKEEDKNEDTEKEGKEREEEIKEEEEKENLLEVVETSEEEERETKLIGPENEMEESASLEGAASGRAFNVPPLSIIENDYVSQKDLLRQPAPFYNRFQGGLLSQDGEEIYYVQVIDMLQPYDCNKKTERCCKVVFLRKDKAGLSVQRPKVYAKRFKRSMLDLVI